jgi:PST family polysaccharide transporter
MKLNSDVKNLINSSIIFYIIQLFNLIAPLLVLPYLSRTLEPEIFGKVALFTSFCGLAYIINDFGFSLSATFEIAKNKENRYNVNKILSCVYYVKFPLFILSSTGFVLLIYTGYSSEYNSLNILCLIGILFFQSYQPIWLFQGLEKMKKIIISIAIPKIIYIVLIITFIKGDKDIDYIFLSLFITIMISSLLINFKMKSHGYCLIKVPVKEIKESFYNSLGFFISRACLSVYTSISSIIIGNYSGLIQLALYSCAEKIYQALQNITAPISQAIYPYLARTNDKSILLKTIGITTGFLIIICLILISFSSELITAIFGRDYINASNILKIFFLTSIINHVNNNFGYPAFATINKIKIVNYTVILGAAIQLFLLAIFIINKSVNAYNISMAILITETIVMLSRIFTFYAISNKNIFSILNRK